MELNPSKLKRDLENGLQPLYYLAGEEALLVEESREAILEAARAKGFDELSRLDIGDSSWQDVLIELNSRSLFAEQRVIEIRLGRNGMVGAAPNTFTKYLENPVAENVVIVRARSFDTRHRRSAWYKKLNERATLVICERLNKSEYFTWVNSRANSMGLNLTPEAVDMLTLSCEGNLVATAQELETLSLIFAKAEEEIEASIVDTQDFSTGSAFDLINSALSADVERTAKMLRVLQREGESPLSLIGLLTYQLRRAQNTIKRSGYAPKDIQAVVRRHGEKGILGLLRQCAFIDGQVKGLYRGDGWSSVMHIFLSVAGAVPAEVVNLAELSRIDYETRDHENFS